MDSSVDFDTIDENIQRHTRWTDRGVGTQHTGDVREELGIAALYMTIEELSHLRMPRRNTRIATDDDSGGGEPGGDKRHGPVLPSHRKTCDREKQKQQGDVAVNWW